MSSLFDKIDENYEETQQDPRPFHSLNHSNEKEMLDWLVNNLNSLEKNSVSRVQNYKNNLAVYKGIQYKSQDARSGISRYDEITPLSKSPRLVTNHLFDLTESKVAQINQIKPAVAVIPSTTEYQDKIAAKSVEALIQHLWYINNIEDLLLRIHRQKYIFGEAFLFILWDQAKGDMTPSGLSNGDISYELDAPWRVHLQKKNSFSEVEFLYRSKVMNIEDLKKKYPRKTGRLSNEKSSIFDPDTFDNRRLNENEVLVHCFYHKKTEFMPEGFYCEFTGSTILVSGALPYNHGQLPVLRISDIDVPDTLHGMSFYEVVKPLQMVHNNLTSMAAKNIFLCAHPKWMMPRGAAKIDQLGNDTTIVQYQGGVPPTLVQSNPTPREVYEFRDRLKLEMEQISAVHGVSRGQPPAGITAAVALQFLNEQEMERISADVVKHNNFIKELARMTISVASEYYDPKDQRMLRIVGKDNKYMLKYFDNANLTKDYDIRIQNSTALPQSKAARLERILEVMRTKPQLLSDERWVDLLEFGQDDKMTSIITDALRAAESENESLLAGEPVLDPQEWEDLIVHWQVHVKEMQKRSFKEDVPAEIQASFIEHVKATEYLMAEKASENTLFEAQLAQLAQFPLFYKFVSQPRSREDQTVQKQGDANMGIPSSASIPAEQPAMLPGEAFQGSSPASPNGLLRKK